MPVFGPLKRDGKVYTRIVEDVSHKTLRRVIRAEVIPESVIYTDSFSPCDGLVLDGFKRFRINRQECLATSKRHHINGIENFRGHAKTRLRSYYGVSREHFYSHLKEMEFRLNDREAADLAALIRKIVRKHEAVPDWLLSKRSSGGRAGGPLADLCAKSFQCTARQVANIRLVRAKTARAKRRDSAMIIKPVRIA